MLQKQSKIILILIIITITLFFLNYTAWRETLKNKIKLYGIFKFNVLFCFKLANKKKSINNVFKTPFKKCTLSKLGREKNVKGWRDFFFSNVGLRLLSRSAAFRVTQSTISFSSIYSVCDSGPTAQFEMCKWSYLGSSSHFIIVESTTVLF